MLASPASSVAPDALAATVVPAQVWQRLAQIHHCAGFAWWPRSDQLAWTASGLCQLGLEAPGPATLPALLAALAAESQGVLQAALARLDRGEATSLSLELTPAVAGIARVQLDLARVTLEGGEDCIAAALRPATPAPSSPDAHVDSLTGLANRRGLSAQGAQAVLTAQRHGWQLALLFVDLDHFKQINDRLGHAAGDEVLRIVARRLRACVRGSDVVARQSGDEFVVILSEVQRPHDAALVAEKILEALQHPVAFADASLSIECSIGVALLSETCADLPALMHAADTAMYAAKQAGRHAVRFYSDVWSQREQRRVEIGASLSQALAREELFLVYQPCLSLGSARVTAVEALLRWRTAEGSVLAPAEFLPMAERNGDIVAIGAWALELACRQARDWNDAGMGFDRLMFNIGAVQLRDKEFPDRVAAACHRSGWPASALELEVSETVLAEDRAATRGALAALHAMGIKVILDDFGGLANLLYLHRYQIRGLKLHRQFALGMEDDPALQEVTAALIGVARSLRLRIAAKGVESAAVAEFLRAHDCDEAQGFHFARPMLAADMALWWQARDLARLTAAR